MSAPLYTWADTLPKSFFRGVFMAKVFNPLSSIKASGKFQMSIFSNWRNLPVVREFVAPTQPRTPRQLAVRALFKEIPQYWANTLPEGLRKAWENAVWKWSDLWGNDVQLTGLNLFLKFNFIIRDFGKAYQTTPPPLPTPPELSLTTPIAIGYFRQGINPVTGGEKTQFDPFVDIWIAGTIKSAAYDPMTLSVIITTDGMPQGVNPVQSDFRHAIYMPDSNEGIQNIFVYSDLPTANFTTPKRIAIILRRYSKTGNYSAVKKVSEIVQPV